MRLFGKNQIILATTNLMPLRGEEILVCAHVC